MMMNFPAAASPRELARKVEFNLSGAKTTPEKGNDVELCGKSMPALELPKISCKFRTCVCMYEESVSSLSRIAIILAVH